MSATETTAPKPQNDFASTMAAIRAVHDEQVATDIEPDHLTKTKAALHKLYNETGVPELTALADILNSLAFKQVTEVLDWDTRAMVRAASLRNINHNAFNVRLNEIVSEAEQIVATRARTVRQIETAYGEIEHLSAAGEAPNLIHKNSEGTRLKIIGVVGTATHLRGKIGGLQAKIERLGEQLRAPLLAAGEAVEPFTVKRPAASVVPKGPAQQVTDAPVF